MLGVEANPEQVNPEIQVGPRLEEVREDLTRMGERLAAFARENPGTCLVGALALGFVVGKIAARY